jgi:hypothetical protein
MSSRPRPTERTQQICDRRPSIVSTFGCGAHRDGGSDLRIRDPRRRLPRRHLPHAAQDPEGGTSRTRARAIWLADRTFSSGTRLAANVAVERTDASDNNAELTRRSLSARGRHTVVGEHSRRVATRSSRSLSALNSTCLTQRQDGVMLGRTLGSLQQECMRAFAPAAARTTIRADVLSKNFLLVQPSSRSWAGLWTASSTRPPRARRSHSERDRPVFRASACRSFHVGTSATMMWRHSGHCASGTDGPPPFDDTQTPRSRQSRRSGLIG